MITYSNDAQREGLKLYRQQDYANAAGAFNNSIKQNPRNYQGFYWLGLCYDQMGQYEQSIAAFKTSRQTIGLTLGGKGDFEFRDKILTSLASVIAKSDQRDIETDAAAKTAREYSSPESWLLLAKIYAYRGDADSALDAYNRAALLDPKNFYIMKDYGLYLERAGQTQRAETPLRRAYSLNQEDPDVIAALRRCHIVPGPSLLAEDQLAKPLVPEGPIPTVRVPGISERYNHNDTSAAAPRD